jgi:hypothetical protein
VSECDQVKSLPTTSTTESSEHIDATDEINTGQTVNQVGFYYTEARGGAVVEALRYKPEGRGFDSRWFYWIFSFTSFRPHYGPVVDSASNMNEYQEYFLGVKAAGE